MFAVLTIAGTSVCREFDDLASARAYARHIATTRKVSVCLDTVCIHCESRGSRCTCDEFAAFMKAEAAAGISWSDKEV